MPWRRVAIAVAVAALAGAVTALLVPAPAHRRPSPNRVHTAALAPAPARALAPAPARAFAIGLTEGTPALLSSAAPAAGFAAPAAALAALHPAYVRLLVDWAKVEPRPGAPPDWSLAQSGCARATGPCAPYAGLRAQLSAIASLRPQPQVAVDLLGMPAWAAAGCGGLAPGALADYRALARSLLALAAQAGVALRWWSPWNEPNNGGFLRPQRCAPALYATLARALATELGGAAGEHDLVLGELVGVARSRASVSGVPAFVAALPLDVVCAAAAWSVHEYVDEQLPAPPLPDAVMTLERALARGGGCGRRIPIWITETGSGVPRSGAPRLVDAALERSGCRVLAADLARWYGDARVAAVFQYSFREDPAFPVGLASADLLALYPAYWLWRAWSSALATGRPPPAVPAQCGG